MKYYMSRWATRIACLGGGWLVLSLAASAPAQAPTTAPKDAVRPIGVVAAIDLGARQMTLKTDAGPEMVVQLQDGTTFLRVPPGEKDLKNATPIVVSDIVVGDRILVRGRVSADQKSIPAVSIIVMTQADIARKHEADRAEWQRRGVSGIITAVNPAARELTISTRTPEGPQPLTIALTKDAGLRRYSPDSVKFSDAKPSTFDELKVADQVRALGTKSEDGRRFTAEEIVSGSFRNIAGTIVSVDPKENTLKITDLATRKPLLVRINADSHLRKLSPFVAQMMARRNAAGAPGAAERSPEGGPPRRGPGREESAGAYGPGSGRGPGGMMGRAGAPDVQQMLERMPALSLTDLKPGDAVIVASTNGVDPAQVMAITLLAGVEPLLAAAPRGGQSMMLGSWSLDMNMNMNLP